MAINKYYHFGKIYLKNSYTNLFEKMFRGFTIAIILFIFINIWKTIYSGRTIIDGFTIKDLIWYLAMSELITFSTGTERIEDISDEVKSGLISNSLSKPINYVLKELAILYANFIYNFLVIGIFAFSLAYLFVGLIDLSIINIPVLIIIILLGATINFLIIITLGLFSFWIEDSLSLAWIYHKAILILGGTLIPLNFYPDWIKNYLYILPTSFITFFPSKLFVNFNLNDLYFAIIGSISWIIILGLFLFFVYKIGIKKVSINGG
ncbi:MAG: ABC-2 family transporter protein [Candidatus Pacearchaeota archaeon]|jgi:ABC-2 type transport system permease protein